MIPVAISALAFAPLSAQDYHLGAPVILLTIFSLGILCFDLFLPASKKQYSAAVALGGLVAAAFATRAVQLSLPATGEPLRAFFGTVLIDAFAVYFYYLFLVGAAVSVLISIKYLEIERENHGEFYALILFAVIGMMCMASGYDLVLLFIGLELMAMSTYVLVGFLRSNRRSNEAALKYLMLGAFSSAMFAYGLSLFYGVTGSTNLGDIARALTQRGVLYPKDPLVILALLTTLCGLLFKIGAAPFHMWAPDAYEGAPTSVTGFMSVAVKAAGWAIMLRILLFGLYPLRALYVPVLVFTALLTLTAGNLAAITQTNTKRLLAYSSIAHVGYMLLGLVASDGTTNRTGIKGILFYLLVYTFMNLGAFAVLTSLRRREVIGDKIEDLAGLAQRSPLNATLMLVFLLSLAGIPPLGGFYGKYFIFLSLIETGHYALAAAAVVFAVIGLYYYLRVANAMFMRQATTTDGVSSAPTMQFAIVITGIATVGIGLFPNLFIQAVNWSVSNLNPSGIALLK
ncbi:MAG TPA: NADH-quinone oxidoreductase subunit N [candidate division Zixibacteria bacterium]|nr:NADH-quinone oxidoreductase subunit N [candidate division Zixibacteria bacterium]